VSIDQVTAHRPGIADPVTPDDDLSFEQLAARYNYNTTSDRRRVLVRLIHKEIARRRRSVTVLDVGCGTGISEEPGVGVEYLRAVRQQVDCLWGIEPDTSIQPTHGLLDHFQHATLETADLPADHFDVAYSYFVMEHVDDPDSFLAAMYRCLKPGGSYLFMTPNGRHYFCRIAGLLRTCRMD